MFDINFFEKVDPLKQKLVRGQFQDSDSDELFEKLDHLRNKVPSIFNIETTNICNM